MQTLPNNYELWKLKKWIQQWQKRKREISALQAKIQQAGDSVTVARQHPKVVVTAKSASPKLSSRKQEATLKDLSNNKDLEE